MADTNVYITGISPEALTPEAFANLPQWASEKTTQQVADILRDIYKDQAKILAEIIKGSATGGTGGSGSSDNNSLSQFQKELEYATKEEKERRKKK